MRCIHTVRAQTKRIFYLEIQLYQRKKAFEVKFLLSEPVNLLVILDLESLPLCSCLLYCSMDVFDFEKTSFYLKTRRNIHVAIEV